MKYIKVMWAHSHADEPVYLYSELDEARREIRKVEFFADGRIGFASLTETTPWATTRLSAEPLPSLDDIAGDPQFHPGEIIKDEFEEVWAKRRQSPVVS